MDELTDTLAAARYRAFMTSIQKARDVHEKKFVSPGEQEHLEPKAYTDAVEVEQDELATS